jgi:hypothetical protein
MEYRLRDGNWYPLRKHVLREGLWVPLDQIDDSVTPPVTPPEEPPVTPPSVGQPSWTVENRTLFITGPGPHLIENKKWDGHRGNCIQIENASNVTIRNCWFANTVSPTEKGQISFCMNVASGGSNAATLFRLPTDKTMVINGVTYNGFGGYPFDSRMGVFCKSNVTNITVENCYFENVETGMGLYYSRNGSGKIHFLNNEIKNVCGPFPRGQMIQLAWVNDVGTSLANGPIDILIQGNYMIGKWGEAFPEDNINVYRSGGTATSFIRIRNNFIKMTDNPTTGTPMISRSGGGILCGDGSPGAAYTLAEGNVLINPGQYGMAINSGHFQYILNNKVYSQRTPVTNVGIYTWNKSNPTSLYYSNRIENNKVHWTHRDGYLNHQWFDSPTAGLVTNIGNVWGSNEVSADMAPPVGCGIRTWSGPLTTS